MVGWAVFTLPQAFAETPLPELAPSVHSAIPLGVQSGSTAEIRFRGKNLDRTIEIQFARKDIAAKVLGYDFYEVRARVEVGPQVPVGLYEYCLRTPLGTHVGVFHVADGAAQAEIEPNNDPAHAQRISNPSLIDGVVTDADYDLYRFHAEAGETVVADLIATRAVSPLDGTLAILNASGHELDFSDDYYMFKDPHLTFLAKQAGDYLVRVGGTQEHGSADSSYRLVIGSIPYMERVLPLGARRGKTTDFQLYGVNLDQVRQVVLGDSLAVGEIVEATPERLRFRMTVPGSTELGPQALRALTASGESPLPLLTLVSDVDEQLSAAARDRNHPQSVQLPTAISGVLERRQAADFFALEVGSGQRVAFRVDSMKLGYLLDPALFIFDSEGKQVAYQDEPAPNSGKEMPNLDAYLVHRFEKAGTYVVMIRDSAQQGQPNYAYRLLMEPVEPAFQLKALTPHETLYRGKTNTLAVRVQRTGGWDTSVEVWLENPPLGIKATRAIAEPKNTPYKGTCGEDLWIDGTNVELQLDVAPDVPNEVFTLHVRARGEMDGAVIEHAAEILYRWGSVGKIVGPTHAQRLLATVTDLPPVVFETPETFSLIPGKTGRLKVIATRFDDGKLPLTLVPSSLPAGVTLDGNVIPPGSNQAELLLSSSDSAEPGSYPFQVRAGNVASPSIELKIAREEEK